MEYLRVKNILENKGDCWDINGDRRSYAPPFMPWLRRRLLRRRTGGGGFHHRLRVEGLLGQELTGASGERKFYLLNCPPTFLLTHRSVSPLNHPHRQVLRTNTDMRTRSNTLTNTHTSVQRSFGGGGGVGCPKPDAWTTNVECRVPTYIKYKNLRCIRNYIFQ